MDAGGGAAPARVVEGADCGGGSGPLRGRLLVLFLVRSRSSLNTPPPPSSSSSLSF